MKTLKRENAYYVKSRKRKQIAYASIEKVVWCQHANIRIIDKMENYYLNDRPLYPPRLIRTIILNNLFSDIIPSITVQESEEVKDISKTKAAAVKDSNLLSFGEEAEEDKEEAVILNKKFSGEGISAHDQFN
ncbi:Peptidyl-prolyl isomerase cwc27 [Eufriesea mexicana]|uniref:Peptidyl-prolyl isomerase cwc27 n=1 Tax=Eufriesea mexicana TaxID=516756 RepID=A0A310S4A3_9HYME|nr:Peptidyl-prolyl isomerase cwc27 [Eufriesea mexicana]